jgi:hypothetical protein
MPPARSPHIDDIDDGVWFRVSDLILAVLVALALLSTCG